ncbi:MAG: hypothetical protein K0R61_4559, partial [Microvirga sp.]|nr:hypothetical protein [Microvirga sp.]
DPTNAPSGFCVSRRGYARAGIRDGGSQHRRDLAVAHVSRPAAPAQCFLLAEPFLLPR